MEKQTFKKYFSGTIDSDRTPKLTDEGAYLSAENVLKNSPLDSEKGAVELHMKGFSQVNYSLPSGTNKVVGSFTDVNNGRIVFFLYNSNASHGIYLYSKDTGNVTLVIQHASFQWSATENIHSVGIAGDNLFWTDSVGPRYVNLDDPTTPSFYDNDNLTFGLYRPQPVNTPDPGTRVNDPSVTINKIRQSSFQFAIRFQYKDNYYSELSDPSDFNFPPLDYDDDTVSENAIELAYIIEDYERVQIKNVLYYVRTRFEDDWRLIKRVPPSDFSDIGGGNWRYTFNFTNELVGSQLSEEDALVQFQSIPVSSDSIAVFENRLFVVETEAGYDVDDSTYTLTLSLDNTIVSEPAQLTRGVDTIKRRHPDAADPNELAAKEGSRRLVGIVFTDGAGRTSGVRSIQEIYVPEQAGDNSPIAGGASDLPGSFTGHLIDSSYNDGGGYHRIHNTYRKIAWDLTGSPPSWASHYYIVATDNTEFTDYFQTVGRVEFISRKLFTESPGDSPESGEYDRDGYRFYKPSVSSGVIAGDNTGDIQCTEWMIELSGNLSFTPEVGDIIRMVSVRGDGTGQYKTQIKEVVSGKYVVVNAPPDYSFDFNPILGDDNWPNMAYGLFEVRKQGSGASQTLFYTQGEKYRTLQVGPTLTFDTPSGHIAGDAYRVRKDGYFPRWRDVLGREQDYRSLSLNPASNVTIVLTARYISFVHLVETRYPQISENYIDGSGGRRVTPDLWFATALANKDDSLIGYVEKGDPVNHNGRVKVEVIGEGRENLSNVIRYSGPYFNSGNINKIHEFESANQYPLPIDRSPITKLLPVKEVLLAIHERNTTSLYIGEGILTLADGSDQLARSERVIGQDRLLAGGFGTVHPESAVASGGTAFWWDNNKGTVVRYTNNGLDPVSLRGYEKEHLDISYAMSQDPNSLAIGSIDPVTGTYFITFKYSGQTKTYGFSSRENGWVSSYDFTPERYAAIDREFYSFLDGEMWKHYDSNTYNEFYGTQYDSKISFYLNPNVSAIKTFTNLALECNVKPKTATIETASGQSTTILDSEFKDIEGVLYGVIRRDENTPNLPGGKPAIVFGDKMKGDYIKVTLEFDPDVSDPGILHFVNTSFLTERGHKV